MNVKTACHLGTCIAVRSTEAIPLVNSKTVPEDGEQNMFTIAKLENAILISGLGKRSKQRFLKNGCTDSVIKHSKKGEGGNTIPYRCFVVKQSEILESSCGLIARGTVKQLYCY